MRATPAGVHLLSGTPSAAATSTSRASLSTERPIHEGPESSGAWHGSRCDPIARERSAHGQCPHGAAGGRSTGAEKPNPAKKNQKVDRGLHDRSDSPQGTGQLVVKARARGPFPQRRRSIGLGARLPSLLYSLVVWFLVVAPKRSEATRLGCRHRRRRESGLDAPATANRPQRGRAPSPTCSGSSKAMPASADQPWPRPRARPTRALERSHARRRSRLGVADR